MQRWGSSKICDYLIPMAIWTQFGCLFNISQHEAEPVAALAAIRRFLRNAASQKPLQSFGKAIT